MKMRTVYYVQKAVDYTNGDLDSERDHMQILV